MNRMKLREYQQRALTDLYKWFGENHKGNPCMVLPTGAGKSVIIAEFCRAAMQHWPDTRILMLTHSRELVGQNADRMRQLWPNAPLGVYSAGLRKRELEEPLTFASVQSIAPKAAALGHIDIILVDECHAISHTETGQYRALINALSITNPAIRIIGCTATPYRLGHGFINEGEDAIFSDLLHSVSVKGLIDDGYLAPLRSKHTTTTLSTEGVGKRSGEYIAGELEKMVDTSEYNHLITDEMIARASDRKSWLIFTTGISHAKNISDILNDKGIKSAYITGKTPAAQRQQIIDDFNKGYYQALSNVGVLTTGFDSPRIDMIAMLRPTLSTGLYVQCAGRGLRIHPEKTDCLVLDFAGNIAVHGPITNPKPTKQRGKKPPDDAEPDTKVCPKCEEIVDADTLACPACGHLFPAPEKPEKPPEGLKLLKLHTDDIMNEAPPKIMTVAGWVWRVHTSKASGKQMLACTYYPPNITDDSVKEYFAVTHDGYAGDKAARQVLAIINAGSSGKTLHPLNSTQAIKSSLKEVAAYLNNLSTPDNIGAPEKGAIILPPAAIKYQRDGKYHKVLERQWLNGKTVI